MTRIVRYKRLDPVIILYRALKLPSTTLQKETSRSDHARAGNTCQLHLLALEDWNWFDYLARTSLAVTVVEKQEVPGMDYLL